MSDLNYTLVLEAINLGGHVKTSTDLLTGDILDFDAPKATNEERSGASTAERSGAARLSSKVHKTPFIEWSSGAGLLKVSRGIEKDAPKGGKRGKVKGFSFASRRRLMYTIAKIKLDAELPVFITLTYPMLFPSPMESKKHIDAFRKRLLRAFPGIGYIWKLEPQERGAPHYHIMAWGVSEMDLKNFIPEVWFEIAGGGDMLHLAFHEGRLHNQHCVNKVRSRNGVMRYASKYLGKTFDVAGWTEIYPGRFWAVVQKENIPFGVECVYEISQGQAEHIIRYQRRFSKMKSRNYSSLTTFCDSGQWIKNIFREVQVKKDEKEKPA